MSVIERSMRLLDVLATTGLPVSLSDLAAQAELPLTTAHRLCAQLLEEGLIEHAADGGLLIGTRTWELGRRHARIEGTRLVAGKFLHDLHEVTRGTVELMLLNGEDLLVIERLSTDTRTRGDWLTLPERVPLHRSGAGPAILAETAEERVKDLRRTMGHGAAEELDAAIREARVGGVVRRSDPVVEGRVTLAAAVRARGLVECAVVLTVDGEQAAHVQAPAVLVTARRISAALATGNE